jgi:hypothetical protein
MSEQRASRYPYFGVPPARQPRPAAQEPALTGKRVVLSTPEGFVYDMRAAGEAYTGGDGSLFIDIVTEKAHFEALLLDRVRVEPVPWPSHLVWVE